MDIVTRPTTPDDIPALSAVLHATALFPSELLPEMIADYFAGGSDELWLSASEDGVAIGFCYATPEKLTDGTWNMLAIAVHPEKQGSGAGRALVAALEATLREAGGRMLIAETSGLAEYLPTQAFYRRSGFTEEARIREFWAAGDDKVVFIKMLT